MRLPAWVTCHHGLMSLQLSSNNVIWLLSYDHGFQTWGTRVINGGYNPDQYLMCTELIEARFGLGERTLIISVTLDIDDFLWMLCPVVGEFQKPEEKVTNVLLNLYFNYLYLHHYYHHYSFCHYYFYLYHYRYHYRHRYQCYYHSMVDLREGPWGVRVPLLILGLQKKRIAEGRKASRASDKKLPVPPRSRSRSSTVIVIIIIIFIVMLRPQSQVNL